MTGNFVIRINPEVVQDSTVRLSLGSGGLVLETNIKLRNAKAVLAFQPFGRLPKLMPVTFHIVSRMLWVTPRTLTEQRKLACPHGGAQGNRTKRWERDLATDEARSNTSTPTRRHRQRLRAVGKARKPADNRFLKLTDSRVSTDDRLLDWLAALSGRPRKSEQL